MHNYKGLIGIDLDDTLLRDWQHTLLREQGDAQPVHEKDLAALRAAEAAGVPVIVATGRSYFSTLPVVSHLGLTFPFVCYNGAWTMTLDGEFIRDLRVPLEMAREILQTCRRLGIAVRVFLRDSVVMSEEPAPDEVFFKFRSYERVDRDIADTLEEPPVQLVVVHLDEVSAFASEFVDTFAEHELRWVLQGRDPETPHLWALHLLNQGSTKSGALARLSGQWGIDRADTLAFGDGPNDVDMVEWAGLGVTFPWGIDEVKAVANLITDPADEAPVATVVRAWLERLTGDRGPGR